MWLSKTSKNKNVNENNTNVSINNMLYLVPKMPRFDLLNINVFQGRMSLDPLAAFRAFGTRKNSVPGSRTTFKKSTIQFSKNYNFNLQQSN